ncbi:hypothetical protein HG531_008822 [Fusarium graminearum]|nr:hypothetical protein HG531_008822 [Fusarium graminearum]
MFEIPAPLASPPPGVSVATSAGIANDAYTTANTGCALGQSSRFFHVRSGRVFVDIIVFLDQSLMIGQTWEQYSRGLQVEMQAAMVLQFGHCWMSCGLVATLEQRPMKLGMGALAKELRK